MSIVRFLQPLEDENAPLAWSAGVVCSPCVTETFQKSGCRAYTVTEEAQPE